MKNHEGDRVWYWLLIFSLLISAAGCTAPRNGQRANITIDDAHGGGSYIAITPDSSLVISGGWSGWLKLWQLPSGIAQRSWRAHQGEVTGIALLQRKKHIVSGGYDGAIRRWSLTGALLEQRQTDSPITHLTIDESQQLILTGHRNGKVNRWQLEGFEQIDQRSHHQSWVRAVAIAPEPGRFASAGADGTVWYWQGDKKAHRLASPNSDIRTLLFVPDGQRLLGGAWFDLYRWDLASDQLTRLQTEHGGIINDIRLHPDGKSLVSISRQTDSAVLRLDLTSGKTLEYFQPHKLCGASVAISRDGQYLASTSDDASVMIWHLLPPTAAGKPVP